ncbi:MAG TPA: hypothetical protein VK689_13990, partial [Armatimonadota bacterium]|nr:hypothetical protein [Armatimonadota bacterium]
PRGATVSELVQAMRAVGAVVDEVTEDEWAARLRGLSDDPSAEQPASECASAAYLALCRCLSGRAFERHRTMDLFQATDTEFGMEATLAGLRGTGIACPPATPELLQLYARAALPWATERVKT